MFKSNTISAVSGDFYPSIRDKDIETKFNFINNLWFHKKTKTEFNYYLSPFSFLVDKKNAKLYLYFYNGETKLLKTYDILTGKEHGDKTAKGDQKTPEGIYFFERYIPAYELKRTYGSEAAKYGTLAIPMNYPNPMDKILEKNGYGIWLHGTETDDRVLRKFDTEGCVAGANIDVENMVEFIQTQTTPIIVMSEFKHDPQTYSLKPKQTLVDFVEKWRAAWSSKDIETYIQTYSENFIDPSTKKTKQQWYEHKNFLNKAYNFINVELKNISYYQHPNYHVVQFIQEYASNAHKSSGLKRLYIKEIADSSYEILSEEYVGLNGIHYIGKFVKNDKIAAR